MKKINQIRRLKGYKGKWLQIKQKGDAEMILRTTDYHFYSGVNVFCISKEKPRSMLLISNYRIPVDRMVMENPAGLAEKHLTVKENGLKEIREETGVS